MIFSFRGLMAPVFTPFSSDGNEIDLEIIPHYAKYLLEKGINGILVNGTSGEGPSLRMSERVLLTERWSTTCKATKQTLMVQVGGAPMSQVLQMAKQAEACGINALLCLPDLYFKPSNCNELIKYLSAVGKTAPRTPLLYYHIPSFTNVNINMAEFLTKVYETNAIPTLAGIKFTSLDLNEGAACLRVGGGHYSIFLGADQIMSAACTLGFDSAIATTLNIVPEYSKKIFESFHNKSGETDIQTAKNNQEELTQIVNCILKYGSWVSSMKAAMNIVSPFSVGPVREPLNQVTIEQDTQMRNDLLKLLPKN